jgi:7-cyano-7-deazaguanine reductase
MSTEYTNLTDIAAKTLGSSASYAIYTEQFDPSLLNPMPRILARESWGIKGDEFVGFDTWHCHEATFLLNNGVPVAGTIKFVYPSDSEFMVESKSAKLYMNSFDMCRMGETVEEAVENYENQIAMDLTNVIGKEVKVKFFKSGSTGLLPIRDYIDLSHVLNLYRNVQITDYNAKENHLEFKKDESGDSIIRNNMYFTNALRSRCRHTKQKDTGTACINIITKNSIVKPVSLFKQIVSLREVNEFHEFCAEKLLTSIMEHEEVVDCVVTLLYSRRGSLDINPSRATSKHLLPVVLRDTNIYTEKAMGQ